METSQIYSPSPKAHTRVLRRQFTELIDQLCEDATNMQDPRAKALFEVSAEMLKGVHKAFTDYEEKEEPACRDSWKD